MDYSHKIHLRNVQLVKDLTVKVGGWDGRDEKNRKVIGRFKRPLKFKVLLPRRFALFYDHLAHEHRTERGREERRKGHLNVPGAADARVR